MKTRAILTLICFLAVVAFCHADGLSSTGQLYYPATLENTQAVPAPVSAATSKLDTFLMVLPWLISGLSILFSFLKAKKDGKTWAEALHVAVNTLKVEDKMVNGAFKPELVEKVGAVSEALQVSTEAKQKVEQILKEGREVDDIKIASINGKPIYLGDIAGIGSTLAAAINRIRKIRLKL